MKVCGFLTLVCGLFFGSLAAHAVTTEYYSGEVSFLSPDSSTSFGKTTSVVKRVINKKKAFILETVVQPDSGSKLNYQTHISKLVRIKNTANFLVSDPDNTYSGEVAFTGDDWNWSEWTYDLTMATGEKIRGNGRITLDGMETEKQFLREGTVVMNIKEVLLKVSEREYQKKLNAITN